MSQFQIPGKELLMALFVSGLCNPWFIQLRLHQKADRFGAHGSDLGVDCLRSIDRARKDSLLTSLLQGLQLPACNFTYPRVRLTQQVSSYAAQTSDVVLRCLPLAEPSLHWRPLHLTSFPTITCPFPAYLSATFLNHC